MLHKAIFLLFSIIFSAFSEPLQVLAIVVLYQHQRARISSFSTKVGMKRIKCKKMKIKNVKKLSGPVLASLKAVARRRTR